MPLEGPDFIHTWRVICARAWDDPQFTAELQRNADQVLTDFGFPPPAGMTYRVVKNEPNELNLVLPASPAEIENVAPAGDRAVSQYYASCV